MLKIIEALTKKHLPGRPEKPRAFVLHCTGNDSLLKCLRVYQDTGDGAVQPHYVIDPDGLAYRIVPDHYIAYHAGLKRPEVALYAQGWQVWREYHWPLSEGAPKHLGGEFSGYRDWRETWSNRGVDSPLGLVTGSIPNGRSIGIEFIPSEHGPFTGAQYQAAAELLQKLGKQYGIYLDRSHILGHADVAPMRRCGPSGPWDPGPKFSHNLLFDLLKPTPLVG